MQKNMNAPLSCNDFSLFDLREGLAEEILETYPDDHFDLVITSPPYNIGKEYEREERLSLDDYLEWLDGIIEKLVKKLKNTGSICWQVGNYIDAGEVFPLDIFFYQLFKKRGLKLRNRIIWRFNFGLNATNRFSGRYETLLWFSKSDEYTFNLDPVRVPQLYPGKRHSDKKGDKAGKPSGNPLGKNPSDYWEFSGEKAFKDDPVWDIPNVKSLHPEKTIHPCQFPIELAERCILAFSNAGDVVLDPFVGTGTSVIASLKHGRASVGIDKSPEYVKIATDRVSKFCAGELAMRPSGKPVRRPKKTEKVAQVPEEWLQTNE
ncbi:DNA-methyltransferase [Kordiimonas aestuarii]|uniref:DNA-methyltransferase n=1 Tax=Kordiimonas aestuarii TaxID=1005925 RepID=UPI0021D382D1|nr:site-specific DNA-methyltransferase [Kordiimonas aestuarii]